MSIGNRQSILICGLSRATCVAMMTLLVYAFPAYVAAQVSAPGFSFLVAQNTWDEEELSALTMAQQKARQLATSLIGKPESSIGSSEPIPLGVTAEQARQLRVQLFTSPYLEGRLAGGRQTFSSPVDYSSSTDQKDARRPLFIPAPGEALMMLEILAQ